MGSVFAELEARGFIEQVSDENLNKWLSENKTTLYVGFDPTADSLHLGHLVPVMAMAHFQRAGHRVIALVGGATGMVGDPSGKSDERNLLTAEQTALNSQAVKKQMEKFLDFSGKNSAILVDNNDWIGKMTFIDWLRDVGKHFTINYMVAKESVKARMASEQGISYTEFSYMTMQAYDFLHLFDKYKCELQCGGNDQWGNITAGIDLVRKKLGGKAFGLTFPLLTTSSGEKFGKTAGNAVWLDPKRTSPYQFYQYWVRTEDADVEKFMKLFTFLTRQEISEICEQGKERPERREAQKALAAEVTKVVHGEEGLKKAQRASEVLFGGEISGLADADLKEIFHDVPSTEVSMDDLSKGIPVVDLLPLTGAAKSKGEARRLIKGGGAYINNCRIENDEVIVDKSHLASESMIVFRTGKKSYHLVRFV